MLLSKILSIHSLNIFALLAYCYLGSIKGSALVSTSSLSTLAMGMFLLTSLFLIYKNYRVVFEAIFSSLKVRLLVSLVILATLLTGTTLFIVPLLFALTAIGKDLKSLLKYYMLWSILILASVVLLQTFGVIATGDMIQYSDEGMPVLAKSLGFNNPNGIFTFVSSILITGYTLLHKSSKKIIFSAIALVSVIAMYDLTLSRTGLICCLLLILFAHLGKILSWEKVKNALPILFIILTLGSVYLALNHGQVGDPVNEFLSNRPYWWNMRVEDGALTNLLGNADSFITNPSLGQDRAPFDSFFLRIWFRNGLLILLLYFVFVRIWSKKVSNKMLVYGALVMLIYGFTEYGVMSNPGRNVILLIMMIPLFSKYIVDQNLKLFGETSHAKTK